ncbi:hypothetical protein KI387_038575, partial [Taxus chinensis]
SEDANQNMEDIVVSQVPETQIVLVAPVPNATVNSKENEPIAEQSDNNVQEDNINGSQRKHKLSGASEEKGPQ